MRLGTVLRFFLFGAVAFGLTACIGATGSAPLEREVVEAAEGEIDAFAVYTVDRASLVQIN